VVVPAVVVPVTWNVPGAAGVTFTVAGSAEQVMPTPEGGVQASSTEPEKPADEVI
jgi:hypothetical protein